MTKDAEPFELIWIVLKIQMSSVLVTDHLNGCGCPALSRMPLQAGFLRGCGRSGLAGVGHLDIKLTNTNNHGDGAGAPSPLHSAPAG